MLLLIRPGASTERRPKGFELILNTSISLAYIHSTGLWKLQIGCSGRLLVHSNPSILEHEEDNPQRLARPPQLWLLPPPIVQIL